jgi:hypothetical protein
MSSPPEQLPDFRAGQDYALFFAVSVYKDPVLTDLEQPVKDAERIAILLEEEYGFQTEIVSNPTLQEVSSKLQEYKTAFASGQLPKDGQLLIYFSGHGMVESGNGYFLASDSDAEQLITTGLSYDLWRDFINEINCQHILVAIDACYSNRFDAAWENRGDPRFRRPGELSDNQRTLDNHAMYGSRIYISADAESKAVPGESDFAKKLEEGLVNSYESSFMTIGKLFENYLTRTRPTSAIGTFGDHNPRSTFLFFVQEGEILINTTTEEQLFWSDITRADTPNAYNTYLRRYPEGYFVPLATAKLKEFKRLNREMTAWKTTRQNDDLASYQKFVREFSESPHVEKAKQRILEILWISEDQFPTRYVLSPNGDGDNDRLVFPEVKNFPNYLNGSVLFINDPDGENILTTVSYQNSWSGGVFLDDVGNLDAPYTYTIPEEGSPELRPAGLYTFTLELITGQVFNGTIELVR